MRLYWQKEAQQQARMAPSERVRGRASGPHTHTHTKRAQDECDLQEDGMIDGLCRSNKIIALVRAYPGRRTEEEKGPGEGEGGDNKVPRVPTYERGQEEVLVFHGVVVNMYPNQQHRFAALLLRGYLNAMHTLIPRQQAALFSYTPQGR